MMNNLKDYLEQNPMIADKFKHSNYDSCLSSMATDAKIVLRQELEPLNIYNQEIPVLTVTVLADSTYRNVVIKGFTSVDSDRELSVNLLWKLPPEDVTPDSTSDTSEFSVSTSGYIRSGNHNDIVRLIKSMDTIKNEVLEHVQLKKLFSNSDISDFVIVMSQILSVVLRDIAYPTSQEN